MEETLTLTRVIENINYVYGQKLTIALFIFVLLEIVALIIISRKKPGIHIKQVRANENSIENNTPIFCFIGTITLIHQITSAN